MNEQDGLNRLKPVLISFLVMSLLSIAPLLNFINLLFCAGIMLGGVAGVLSLKKQFQQPDSAIAYKDAVLIGVFSGIMSAVFVSGFNIITMMYSDVNPISESLKFFGDFVKDLPPEANNQINNLADEFNKYGYSPTLAVFTFISNLIIYPLFGAIGALITATIVNNKNKNTAKL